jgi:hypothetical protein
MAMNFNVLWAAAESETLPSIDRAREVLGFEPAHSWRDHLAGTA